MKCELKNNDDKPADTPLAEPPVNPPAESSGTEPEESGEPEESRENPGGGGTVYALLLLLGVGVGWVLLNLRQQARTRHRAWLEEQTEEEVLNQRVPAFPGF